MDVALLGWWWLGLAPAAALLLGSALSPTDPVLAGDVGVPDPGVEPDLARDNEIRFTLTTEAGLNDGLAMPFVLVALLLAGTHVSIGTDVLLPLPIGVLVGLALGRLLAWAFFRIPSSRFRLAEYSDGLVLLALAFLPFAVAELLHGNGFLAVFTAAVCVRTSERSHGYHEVLHTFGRQLERLFVAITLLGLGFALGDGLLRGTTLLEVLFAAVAVFVIRPLTGVGSLIRSPARGRAALAIAFFGVRGIGTLYYLAYGLHQANLPGADQLWRVGALAVALSVLIHGILAAPVMRRVEERGAHVPRHPGRAARSRWRT
ncbi:cation:proton antiporter domain-containing protein [Amycolatopsis nivea]|uniref:cation:proton antiporter domain-containing protein n=1 Tax=Amycolatopsis nivea TaxID=1644109 RepID=UPI001F10EFCD|nr:cation:proton antiporter [Amycolatopsis nivea]